MDLSRLKMIGRCGRGDAGCKSCISLTRFGMKLEDEEHITKNPYIFIG
jgi:hypothetical protein